VSSQTETATRDAKAVVGAHDLPKGVAVPDVAPLARSGRRRTPAEEARTLIAANGSGTLATLSEDGTPWASLVTYGALEDGSPVLLLSTLAEHGRNLLENRQASLMVQDPNHDGEPLAGGRVTLAGRAVRPEDHPLGDNARRVHLEAVPSAEMYADFNDFSFWILEVDRARWVGGYGRMDTTYTEDYSSAEPDPVHPAAAHAVSHMNEDHSDALLDMARSLAGISEATAAECVFADRYGLDLTVTEPSGRQGVRVEFSEPVSEPDGLRAATVDLARRARSDAPA
jgi:putative heme iron utilization protein